MKAQIMISSVVRDEIKLGNIAKLTADWFDAQSLKKRVRLAKLNTDVASEIPFSFVRAEIKRHLEGKYGFDVYIFEEAGGSGRSPEDETSSIAATSQLVIGIFGVSSGAKIGDQDPLTPTLREWRVALQTPLKFRVFWLKDSAAVETVPEPLRGVLSEISDYQRGKVYWVFADFVDLCLKIDRAIQQFIQVAITRYVADTVVLDSGSETEDWLLSAYKDRAAKMEAAFQIVAESVGVLRNGLHLASMQIPITLTCVPDNFSIPESRKFAAYVFDAETGPGRKPGERGKVHFIAAFGGVSDSQVRRHLGNFESAKVFRGPWGLFASEPQSGTQCVYLPGCVNSLIMQARMGSALAWLETRASEISELSIRRQQILDVLGAPSGFKAKPSRGTRGPLKMA